MTKAQLVELVKNAYPCSCNEAYKSRGLVAPDCFHCVPLAEAAALLEHALKERHQIMEQALALIAAFGCRWGERGCPPMGGTTPCQACIAERAFIAAAKEE